MPTNTKRISFKLSEFVKRAFWNSEMAEIASTSLPFDREVDVSKRNVTMHFYCLLWDR